MQGLPCGHHACWVLSCMWAAIMHVGHFCSGSSQDRKQLAHTRRSFSLLKGRLGAELHVCCVYMLGPPAACSHGQEIFTPEGHHACWGPGCMCAVCALITPGPQAACSHAQEVLAPEGRDAWRALGCMWAVRAQVTQHAHPTLAPYHPRPGPQPACPP